MSGAVKVANISPVVTREVLADLFSLLGDIRSLNLQQSSHNDGNLECIVEYIDPIAAITALHLTGTDLGDRTLFVTNAGSTSLPKTAPIPLPPAPANASPVTSSVTASPSAAVRNSIIHPTVLHFDPAKAEEIARTVYIGNISSSISEQELTEVFAACGPVAYVKMAGDPQQAARFAFLEFATQEGATQALTLNNVLMGDRALKVNHSKNAINKTPKKPDIQQDSAMRRVREAQMRIANKYSDSPDDDGKSISGESGRETDRDGGRWRHRSRSRTMSPYSRDYDFRDRGRDGYRDRRRSRSLDRDRDEYPRRRRSRSRDRRRPSRDRDRVRDGHGHRHRSRSREDRDREKRRRRDSRDGNDRDKVRDKDREKKIKAEGGATSTVDSSSKKGERKHRRKEEQSDSSVTSPEKRRRESLAGSSDSEARGKLVDVKTEK
ncbi:Protein srek1IP1 [Rhizophlyctis rosea]|uniref:Protein srek1IP1 n=1 Tax=Rhizophlyctis rosea TaxID=64517 RepID=A0AAD5SN45_9FUNG|nr:Protein srek1IP1 [Rhizophlyctis rosea]